MNILCITPVAHLNGVLSTLSSRDDIKLVYLPDCNKNELLSYNSNVTAIFTNPNKSSFRLDSTVLSNLPCLKVIATASTGRNHIDLDYCQQHKINVISLTEERVVINQISSTAEHAFALMMSLLRNIPSSFDDVLIGNWNYEPFIGRQLKELTIGVIGYGRLGSFFSNYCDAFGSKVLVYDPYKSIPHPRIEQVTSLDQLFSKSDVVSIHVHYSKETVNLIDSHCFDAARDDLLLVNTSRGGVVDETSLVYFLENNRRAKYATDVLNNEMGSLDDSPILVYAKKNSNQCLITPHIAGMTLEGQNIAFNHAAKLLINFLNSIS